MENQEQQDRPRPLTQEEFDALAKDLQEVLSKHGAEMGVQATIQLTKSAIPSPYVVSADGKVKEEETPKTSNEGGGESTGGESSKS